MSTDLFIPGEGDPLGDVPAVKARRRIPRSDEGVSWAKVEKTTLMKSRFFKYYPPRSRLFLLLRIRTADGQYSAYLTNVAAAAIGLSRYQKSRLLKEMEEDGVITVERRIGCSPVVTLLVTG
jgi:hypothetical protein